MNIIERRYVACFQSFAWLHDEQLSLLPFLLERCALTSLSMASVIGLGVERFHELADVRSSNSARIFFQWSVLEPFLRNVRSR